MLGPWAAGALKANFGADAAGGAGLVKMLVGAVPSLETDGFVPGVAPAKSEFAVAADLERWGGDGEKRPLLDTLLGAANMGTDGGSESEAERPKRGSLELGAIAGGLRTAAAGGGLVDSRAVRRERVVSGRSQPPAGTRARQSGARAIRQRGSDGQSTARAWAAAWRRGGRRGGRRAWRARWPSFVAHSAPTRQRAASSVSADNQQPTKPLCLYTGRAPPRLTAAPQAHHRPASAKMAAVKVTQA